MTASARLSKEFVKQALKLQAYGGAVGPSYVQRTLEHLQQCHDYFKDDVVGVRTNIQATSSHAFQRFVYENIPQLKYRNKHTAFNCTISDDVPTVLEVKFADGRVVEVDTEQLQSAIYNDVVKVTTANKDEPSDT
eukprot:gene6054-6757_t